MTVRPRSASALRAIVFSPGHRERGGGANVARYVAEGLASRGWDVRAITWAGSARVPRVRRSERLLVVELPWIRGRRLGAAPFLAAGISLGIAWGGRRARFVAIQLTAPAVAAGVCARVRRGRFVGLALTSGRGAEIGAVAGARRRLLASADLLVGQTEFAADEIAAAVPGVPTAVVPTGVRAVGPPPLTGLPRALFAGRLNSGKGAIELLEAWASVARSDADARLTIAGDGRATGLGWEPVEARLRRTIASSPELRRSVEMPGWVDELGPLLAGADVFVLPSHSEGMSHGLLEACVRGRVVVASDIAGNRAVLGDDYPLLFEPGDVDALAAALRSAFGDDSTRRACVEMISARSDRFELDSVLDRLEALIR